MRQDIKWRKTVNWLRKAFPTKKPVKTRRLTGIKRAKDYRGVCWLEQNKYFVIHVNRSCSFATQVDILLHEWAHALTWFGSDNDDHGDEWALAQGRIYRAFLEWRYG
jgi:hypothetical protein